MSYKQIKTLITAIFPPEEADPPLAERKITVI